MGVWISRGNFISLLYKACAVSLYTILVRKIGGHFVTLFFNMSQNDLKLPNRILLIFSAIHIKSFAFRFATPKSSPKIPVVNTERCIGCGACENLCPARPFSAIYVEGHEMHRVI